MEVTVPDLPVPKEEVDNASSNSKNKSDNLSQPTINSIDKESLVDFTTASKELNSKDLSHLKESVLSDIKGSQNIFQKFFSAIITFPQNLQEEKIKFLSLAKVPYDEWEALHLQMLVTIYNKLTEKYVEVERYGNHWEEIGFQGPDPATDLRGVGILGLLQLVALVTYYQKYSAKMLSYSQHAKYNFPLCLSSFNMTQIVKELLREGKLDDTITEDNSVWKVCNDLYFAMFFKLFDMYQEKKFTIEQYPRAQKDIEEQARADPNKLIQEFRFKVSMNFRYS